MDYIGIKELKNQAPRIMKAVREEGARYVVTYHGRPTALIVPLDEAEVEAKVAEMMRDALIGLDEDTELERELAALREEIATATVAQRERKREELRQEIAAAWNTDLTAVEVISEQRR